MEGPRGQLSSRCFCWRPVIAQYMGACCGTEHLPHHTWGLPELGGCSGAAAASVSHTLIPVQLPSRFDTRQLISKLSDEAHFSQKNSFFVGVFFAFFFFHKSDISAGEGKGLHVTGFQAF